MDDEIEAAPEKPKRRYTRRPSTGNELVDAAVNDALDREIDRLVEAEQIADGDVVEVNEGIAVEEIEKPSVSLLYQEPRSNSLKAMIGRATGLFSSMEIKVFDGRNHWACTKCGFDTFKKDRADKHRC